MIKLQVHFGGLLPAVVADNRLAVVDEWLGNIRVEKIKHGRCDRTHILGLYQPGRLG